MSSEGGWRVLHVGTSSAHKFRKLLPSSAGGAPAATAGSRNFVVLQPGAAGRGFVRLEPSVAKAGFRVLQPRAAAEGGGTRFVQLEPRCAAAAAAAPVQRATQPVAAAPPSATVAAREEAVGAPLLARQDWRPPPPAARVSAPPRVVNVTYVVKPVAEVVAWPAARAAGAERAAPPRAATAPACAAAAGLAETLRGAVAAVAAASPVLDAAALAERADEGVVTRQDEIQQRQLQAQAARLAAVLPLEAVAKACACTVGMLSGLSAERLAHHLVDRRMSKWRWSTVKDLYNVYVRWLAWLERHDVSHDGVHFNAVDLGDFFEEVDAGARAKAPANKARAEAADAVLPSAAELDDPSAMLRRARGLV